MARKTNRKQKKQQKRTKKVKRAAPAPASAAIAPAPAIESHSFKSSMTFDGNKLVTKSQKDNEPVKERIYTMKQLEQEIPIGKELIDAHLDGKMPQGLQDHNRRHMKPTFNNVLLHPADLGLLPPSVRTDKGLSKRRSIRRGRRSQYSHKDDLRLMVDDDDVVRQKHLFDLP